MKFTILTIHPELFDSFKKEGLLAKALQKGALSLNVVNIRDFSDPPHHRVDDHPYGGGPGMVLKVEPIVRALKSVIQPGEKTRVVVLAAKGASFTQERARVWQQSYEHLILICGRYEGIDERIREFYAHEEIRIGDYVLMGGEIPAAVIVETVGRLCPGVLGNPTSLEDESFKTSDSKEYAQYTRPPEFEGHEVPQVLQDGNHAEIKKWRSR